MVGPWKRGVSYNPKARVGVEAINAHFDDSYVGEPNSGCWLWDGAFKPNKRGYVVAMMHAGGRNMIAPRYSYERFVGPLPRGAFVCHRCNVSLCVNPKHLYAGTAKTNAADAVACGAVAHGERNHLARLKADQVRAILRDDRYSDAIAADYGVSPSTIRLIKRRRTWRRVAA